MTEAVRGDDGAAASAAGLPVWRFVASMIANQWQLWLPNLGWMLLLMGLFQVPPLLMREFFHLLEGPLHDRAAAASPYMLGVWAIVALLLAAHLGRSLAIIGLTKTNVPFMNRTATLLRLNMLRQTLRRPGAAALPYSPGEAISRFRGDVRESQWFALMINDLVGLILFSAVAVAVMAATAPWVTAAALLPFVAIFFVARSAADRIRHYRRASRAAAGAVTGFLGELFGGVQAVKVGTASAAMLERLRVLSEHRRKVTLRDRLFNEVLDSIFRHTVNVGVGIVMLLAARGLRLGSFTVGDMALFVFYLEFISELAAFAGEMLSGYRQLGISVERMQRLMAGARAPALVHRQPLYLAGAAPPLPVIMPVPPLRSLELRDVDYRHPNGRGGLQRVNLRVEPGTLTVVTGTVGAGKTTLLRVLLGLLPASAGQIRWNGEVLAHPDRFLVPPRIGYVPQRPGLFSDSLQANVRLGWPAEQEELAAALRAAVLEHDLAELDDGLDTAVGPKGVKLSGGQIQRVAAARMFVRRPQLMVIDDVSSALDVETERALWDRLLPLRAAAVLAVSHRRLTLQRADRIVVLRNGAIEAAGTLAQLLQSSAQLRTIWEEAGGGGRQERQPT